ncbi:hypothetical protein GSI_09331 [Ganoderma sinense ZZ0214-1]|uniref:Uncharacterized protein n=1 Tax=Ganoderma sinense ZZ0214-1 TaxID=1077348 RepID=A0A2G8S676_9APHY|nr:hypothetical protein GSI_09331 [Ganoderma sinense ZZ0214-1]
MDGSSGILDNAREIKIRVKAFSAPGNGTTPFGPNNQTKWNPGHFLDTAEFTATFAIAYDWLCAEERDPRLDDVLRS